MQKITYEQTLVVGKRRAESIIKSFYIKYVPHRINERAYELRIMCFSTTE